MKQQHQLNLFGVLQLICCKQGIKEDKLHKIIRIGVLDPEINYPFTFEYYNQPIFSYELNSLLNQLINDDIVKTTIYTNQIKLYKLTCHGKDILRAIAKEDLKNTYKDKINMLWNKHKYSQQQHIVNRIRELEEKA